MPAAPLETARQAPPEGTAMPERIEVRSASTGGVDYIEQPTNEEAYVAALFRERRGYEINGDEAAVEAVNKELRRLGALNETAGGNDGNEQRAGRARRSAGDAAGRGKAAGRG
jgi:hypothetical protein